MKNWLERRDDIINTPLPVYEGGDYTVIPHSVFLDELQLKIIGKGYEIIEERYLTADNNKIITGVFKLKGDDIEMSPSVSFVNSYNKKRRAEIRGSAMILVCKNGMMATTDNGYYSRKHSGNALEDFRNHMSSVIDGLEEEFKRLVIVREQMKTVKIDRKTLALLIGDMFINENMINPTQLNIFNRELKHSTNFSNDNLWDFYNNITESFKDSHPMIYDKQHIKLHTYIIDQFNLEGSRGLFKSII